MQAPKSFLLIRLEARGRNRPLLKPLRLLAIKMGKLR